MVYNLDIRIDTWLIKICTLVWVFHTCISSSAFIFCTDYFGRSISISRKDSFLTCFVSSKFDQFLSPRLSCLISRTFIFSRESADIRLHMRTSESFSSFRGVISLRTLLMCGNFHVMALMVDFVYFRTFQNVVNTAFRMASKVVKSNDLSSSISLALHYLGGCFHVVPSVVHSFRGCKYFLLESMGIRSLVL